MPNWKTHLEISKELNKSLKYNKEEYELFAFGSILPDINNGHLVKDISKILEHRITHFKGEYNSYINFYNKYKDNINNPLILGYFTHLYTDFNWNKNFYENDKIVVNNEADHIKMRQMKQYDFMIYNNEFVENTIEINHIDKILEDTKKIEEVSITKEDIIKVKQFLDNKEKYEYDFKFYSLEQLDKLKDETIEILKNMIKNGTFN